MTKQELYKLHEKNEAKEINFDGICQDCGKATVVTSTIVQDENGTSLDIKGGAICQTGNHIAVKCDTCFEIKQTFGSPTEVYARVVGYLRPIKQWNKGKQAEWDKRTIFNSKKALAFAEGEQNDIPK